MTMKMRAVLRSAIQGFMTGATLALSQSQLDLTNGLDITVVKALGIAALTAGLAGVWSAIHNYLLDPSAIPSLAQPNS